MDLAISNNWEGLETIASENSTVSISGAVLKCSSLLINESARLSKYIKVSPGETITVSVLARRTKGESGALAIDFPSTAKNVNMIEISSCEWQEYSLSYSVPLIITDDDYLTISFGSFTGLIGSAEFMNPRIILNNTSDGALRTYCAALIRIGSGEFSVNRNFVSHNIREMRYDDKKLELTIQSDAGITGSGSHSSPIFQVSKTPDYYPEIDVKVGFYERATGEIKLKFYDTKNHIYVDILNYPKGFLFYIVGTY